MLVLCILPLIALQTAALIRQGLVSETAAQALGGDNGTTEATSHTCKHFAHRSLLQCVKRLLRHWG